MYDFGQPTNLFVPFLALPMLCSDWNYSLSCSKQSVLNICWDTVDTTIALIIL